MTQQNQSILLMIGAIFLFSTMDGIAKTLTGEIGVWPTLWVRYLGQTLLVTALILPRFRTVARTRFPGLQLARSVFLMGATTCFFFGIANIGLAEATAVMDLNPVLITLGAALFLGERIGLRRVLGILVSLFGALIVIRPGSDVFSPYSLFPLAAAVFYTGYNLSTRFVGSRESPWTALFYTGLFGAVVFSLVVPFHWQPVSPRALGLIAALSLCATAAQLLLIRALSLGEASMLAPFAYLGLIFSAFWGFVLFDAVPDRWTVLGAAIIAASGFYVWHRDRKPPATDRDQS